MKKFCLALTLFMLAAVIPSQAQAKPYNNYPYVYEDFEEKAESAVSWANADYQASSDGYGKSAGSLKITVNGDGQMIRIPVSLEAGKTYNISCYIKPGDDVIATYVNFIFWFKQKQADGTAGTSEGFSTARVNDVILKVGEWTKVSTQYTFDGQANIDGKMTDVVGDGTVSVRFGNGNLDNLNGKKAFTYNIDDLCIEPEFKESEVKEPYKEVNLISNGDFAEDLGDEWTASNADAEITDDIPPEGCDALQSLHIQQTERFGKVYQNINVRPNTRYKLSFWAKGVAEDYDSWLLAPVIEWNEDSGSQYEYIDNSAMPLGEEWNYYEVIHTTDADVADDAMFYIYTNRKLKKSEFYLTDIKLLEWPFDTAEIENPDEVTTPEIRDITADGYLIKNNTISVNAEYLGPNPQTGLIQFFKQAEDGGWASIKTAEFNGAEAAYTFKASDIGQNIQVRIVPMDTEGNVGGYRIKELGKVLDTFEISQEFTTGLDAGVSAAVHVENWSGENKDIICMLLLYDKDNACIASTYRSVNMNFEDTADIDISVENPGDAVKAKVFTWEGTSDINTNMQPIARSIELTR